MTDMNAAAVEAESELSPTTDTPETEPEVTTETTDTTTETPTGNEPAPETPEFDPLGELEKLELDPRVKEELKKGFLRQSDYTKKTQEIAATRKAAEQYERVRPLVERLFSDPNLTNQILGIKPETPANPEEEVIPDDPKAYAEYVIQKATERIKADYDQREQERQVTEARERDYNEAEKLDSRLNDEKFGTVIAGLVAQNPSFKQGQISAVEATKQAIADFDTWNTAQINKAKEDLTRKAREKRSYVSPSSNPITTATGNPTSMREASKLAEQDLAN